MVHIEYCLKSCFRFQQEISKFNYNIRRILLTHVTLCERKVENDFLFNLFRFFHKLWNINIEKNIYKSRHTAVYKRDNYWFDFHWKLNIFLIQLKRQSVALSSGTQYLENWRKKESGENFKHYILHF